MSLRHFASLFLCIISSVLIPVRADDSIPSGFELPVRWHVGADIASEYVIGTDNYLRGANPEGKNIDASLIGAIRADFSLNPATKEGMLYKGLYQGIGLGIRTFFHNSLLGTPGSAYVYQGAPFANFGSRLHLGYEWRFGIAFGWHHTGSDPIETSSVISTAVTAHMGVALRLQYDLSDRFTLSAGIEGTHFSNGNTSWRNAGLNSVGASLGLAYILNPQNNSVTPAPSLIEEADRGRWFYDIMGFGAWRQRLVYIPINGKETEALAPGKYPVFGIQVASARRLNRWVAVGPALDLQWDKSADMSRHWKEGTSSSNLSFYKIPFRDQISLGLSAHAELTAPFFSVNAGIGYNLINPKGDRAFYQSLTVKAFATKHLYLNVGYRLGAFKDPHNIMLGVGWRF